MKHISLFKSSIALILFSTATVIASDGATIESRLQNGHPIHVDDLMTTYSRPYTYLIEGNKKDLEGNRKISDWYFAKIDGKRSANKENIKNLAELYKRLAELNEGIISDIRSGNVNDAKLKSEKIPVVEKEIEAIVRKKISREWLTFSEMKSYLAHGYKYKTSDPQILPMLKSNWVIKRIPKTDSKQSKLKRYSNAKSKSKNFKTALGRDTSK